VRKGYASFLTLEFGRPHLHVREPYVSSSESRRVREGAARRRITVHGDWHLWIYCCDWAVFQGSRLVGDSESSDLKIHRAARCLDGRKLVAAHVFPHGMRSLFEFETGARLETKPYGRTREQWLLYEPGGNVLVVRADRTYSYGKGNRPPDRKQWRPIRA
jgi:hypothetical protein